MDTRLVKPMGTYLLDPTRARLTLKEGDQLSRITITPCMPLKNPRKWTHNIGWLKVHFIYCKVFDRYLKFLSFPWGRILENEEASGWSQFQQVLPISFGVIHIWRCENDEINKGWYKEEIFLSSIPYLEAKLSTSFWHGSIRWSMYLYISTYNVQCFY